MPKIDIPAKLLCPLTKQMFKNPVIADDGHIYELSAITTWQTSYPTSPITRQNISNRFISALEKKTEISEFLQKNKIPTFQMFVDAMYDKNLDALQTFNFTDELLQESDANGKTLLHKATSIGLVNIVALFLNERVDPNCQDKDGVTPLHLVYDIEIANLLINHKANVNARTKTQSTPLHYAAAKGRVEIVKILLSKGANPEAEDSQGLIPANMRDLILDQYVTGGGPKNYDEIDYYLDRYTPAIVKEHGTELHLAVYHNRIKEVQGILDCMAAPSVGIEEYDLTTANEKGETPLHVATNFSSKKMMRLVLSSSNINLQDKDGNTALHLATKRRNSEKVRLLLDRGANHTIKNKQNQTPAEIAISSGNKNLISMLTSLNAHEKITHLTDIVHKQQLIIEKLEQKLSELTATLQQKPTENILTKNLTSSPTIFKR